MSRSATRGQLTMPRKIALISHLEEGGENDCCKKIQEIREHGIPGLNELIKEKNVVINWAGCSEITKKTMEAYYHHVLFYCSEYKKVLGHTNGNPLLGNSDQFKTFAKLNAAIGAEKKCYGAYLGITPSFVEKIQAEMSEGVLELCTGNRFSHDCLFIIVGHNLMIEWLAIAVDKEERIPLNLKLKELTGFVFEEKAGELKIAETIGF